jgi:hypothetical protein
MESSSHGQHGIPHDGDYGYRTHLVDCRSYGGFSGSPCFVELAYPGLIPMIPMTGPAPEAVGRMQEAGRSDLMSGRRSEIHPRPSLTARPAIIGAGPNAVCTRLVAGSSVWGQGRVSMSAMRSAASSTPTDSRTRPPTIPRRRRSSSVSPWTDSRRRLRDSCRPLRQCARSRRYTNRLRRNCRLRWTARMSGATPAVHRCLAPCCIRAWSESLWGVCVGPISCGPRPSGGIPPNGLRILGRPVGVVRRAPVQ